MSFTPGALVRARGREWVVLPERGADPDVLWLRPLGAADEDRTGIYLPLESVEPAIFEPPDPSRHLGNHTSASLLYHALRLGFRSGAGPFRSLAHIGVDPRPYQLVPLLLALRQDPVRLLIADDVGIGKTIEACLIARELLDRGEIGRFCVLCPPQLVEGWVQTLRAQFHVPAEAVTPGSAARLDRSANGVSVFERYDFTVVSIDFIKSERRRADFLRAAPELIIVDEAHGCAATGSRASQQRHTLLRELLQRNTSRHLLLVTATPHSGDEAAFRSLLGLLDPSLAELPLDLSGDENRNARERLARHFVQRRRADLRDYLATATPFPERQVAEVSYSLSPAYGAFFDEVLRWSRERVLDPGANGLARHVRWWAVLGLLRALGSSPLAAAAALRSRAASAGAPDASEADLAGRRTVLDQDDASQEGHDLTPGAQVELDDHPEARRLLGLAEAAEALAGKEDLKLARAGGLITELLAEGFAPIVFCRFLATVDYVAAALERQLGPDVHIARVTGAMPPEDRLARMEALVEHPRRVLVCTDCLSEGVNLQGVFDAVLHYDLSWNPTRHEQREGRVDRYGQPRPVVRAITLYGRDNPIDEVVLKVLLRKHRAIHAALGVSVPVPADTDLLLEALLESSLLGTGRQLPLFTAPDLRDLDLRWERAAEREEKSRRLFARHALPLDEVSASIEEARLALGGPEQIERFVTTALDAVGAPLSCGGLLYAANLPERLRRSVGLLRDTRVSFVDPPPPGAEVLTRTHPLVAGLATWILESALDDRAEQSPARRAAVIPTRAVTVRTTVALLRCRFQIRSPGDPGHGAQVAEDLALFGWSGSGERTRILEESVCNELLQAEPAANRGLDLARPLILAAREALSTFDAELAELATRHADRLRQAHRKVRRAGGQALRGFTVEPFLPVDVVGLYVYLPAGGAP